MVRDLREYRTPILRNNKNLCECKGMSFVAYMKNFLVNCQKMFVLGEFSKNIPVKEYKRNSRTKIE